MSETLNLPYTEAALLLESQAAEFLLRHKDPARTTDLAPIVTSDAVNARVIREVLSHSPRFVSVNRKWDLAIRHSMGAVTVDRVLDGVLRAFGKPLRLPVIASELALIVGRTPEYYESILPLYLESREHYVNLQNGEWSLIDWILSIREDEEETIFANFFMSPEEAELEALRPVAERHKWNRSDLAGSAQELITSLDQPISNRVLSYFAWKAAPEEFDPVDFFNQLRTGPRGLLLPGCRWCPASLRRKFDEVYTEIGQREEETLPPEEAEEIRPREERPIKPLDNEDLEQVYNLILGSDRSWRVPELVESAYDLTDGDRGYDEAVRELSLLMVDDDRFLWVGTDRWREANSLPEFVYEVPEPLTIQQFIFENEEGEPIDFEMDDRGIDDGLLDAMKELVVQDYGDRDEVAAPEEMESFEFALARHHRETGTLPVIPAIRGLFPPAPDVIELLITPDQGDRFPVWLNDTLENVFGLGMWYVTSDLPLSGARLSLTRTRVPGEYRLEYSGETDPRLAIDDARMEELELLKLEGEGENPIPTFEILRRVMQPSGTKGVSFARLWAEVNVVRRTTRRMIASLLSGYQCFNAVTRGSDIWAYDEKRVPMGVNKTKRRFIREVPVE